MLTNDELIKISKNRRSLPPSQVRREIRKSAELTQDQIAAALGVERATVSRWETGLGSPRGRVREAYAELLNRLQREVLSA